jgi:hypothetical protein
VNIPQKLYDATRGFETRLRVSLSHANREFLEHELSRS